MNDHEVRIVQASWDQVLPIADQAAALFYGKLFATAPEARALFTGDMEEQGRRLMQMITTVVRSLTRLGRVLPAIEALGRRHSTYGVQPAHYDLVGAALLWTLEQGLGDAWHAELAAAWATAYGLLAQTMIAAAEETELAA